MKKLDSQSLTTCVKPLDANDNGKKNAKKEETLFDKKEKTIIKKYNDIFFGAILYFCQFILFAKDFDINDKLREEIDFYLDFIENET
jgi:hypothetical protein